MLKLHTPDATNNSAQHTAAADQTICYLPLDYLHQYTWYISRCAVKSHVGRAALLSISATAVLYQTVSPSSDLRNADADYDIVGTSL